MKRMMSMFMMVAIIVTALTVCTKADGSDVADNIVYEVYDCYWDGGKLVVEGCIANLNRKYDILGLEDTELVVMDANGQEFGIVKLNNKFEAACYLRPMSKIPYNFTMSKFRYDKDKYASLSKGVEVSISTISGSYGTCEGRNCRNCNYNGYDLDENPFESNEKTVWLCTLCRQTGKCCICGGDGVDEAMEVTIWGTWCTVCKGTGICHACGGDGIRP